MQPIIRSLVLACCAGCAGVSYQTIPQTPLFVVPDEQQTTITAERRADILQANEDIAADNRRRDEMAKGFRYYQPSSYLLVYSDGKGGIVWEIHQLPDASKEMSARPYNYFSTLEAKLTFDDHYLLTATHELADSTVIPNKILSSIEALAPRIVETFVNKLAPSGGYTLPAPHLYKIVSRDGQVQLVGGRRTLDKIQFTLSSPVKL